MDSGLLQHCRDVQPRRLLGQHMVDSRAHRLSTKVGDVNGMALALVHKFLVISIPEGLSWASLRTPGLEVLAGAVVAEVTLLHQSSLDVELGHTKGAGVDAITAADTAGRIRLLDNAFSRDQDRNGRADLGARCERVLAVHADGGLRRHTTPPVHEVYHHHAFAFMRVAFAAGCLACPAADAAGGINE